MTTEGAGNPKGHGQSTDYTPYIVDQNWARFTAQDHDVWKTLYRRQREILPGRACQEFIDNMDTLGIDETIPDFRELSVKLKERTGWEVVAVPGLIPDLPFFQLLADRKFPAGNFIRRRDQLDYIEEPDVFHDVFGHVPLLANPVFADYIAAYGEGGLRAHDHGTITNLARLYWFTVEFGLIDTKDGLRIYGAGILSSPGESMYALEDPGPSRIAFDLKRIMQTEYKVDDYQKNYFVIDGFQQLFNETYQDFSELYGALRQAQNTYPPGHVLPDDRLYPPGRHRVA